MKKRTIVNYIGVLFFIYLIIIHPASAMVYKIEQQYLKNSISDFLYVGGSGPDNYSKIQDAINDSVDGNTVYVYNDSSPYKELLVINKSISLIGEDKNTTVIDGEYKGTVVDIQKDGILVSGFTLLNCKILNEWDYNVVQIIGCENVIIENNLISVGHQAITNSRASVFISGSSNNFIKNNILYDGGGSSFGIRFRDGSSFNNVSGNEIYDYTNGVSIGANDNIFYGNNIHNNLNGIVNFGDRNNFINNLIYNHNSEGIRNDGASNTLITGNSITNNGEGGGFDAGISFISEGSNNHIINNEISNNNPTGVYISTPDNNIITDNHITDNNNIGIYLLSDNNQIADNHISSNTENGIYIGGGSNNIISKNNFINNVVNADFDVTFITCFSNKWRNNYWSDYSGEGVYIIRGSINFLIFFIFPWFNIDWFPVLEPYEIEI